jgi:23S rRNA pseudouridine1911/1915/1917 synthase
MNPEKQFHFICDEEGKRLDTYLSERFSITRTKIKRMIDEGHVRIAGKPSKPSVKTKNLMEIDGEIPEEEPLNLEPQEIPLSILYEDEYFLAVNKPKGMVVHPSFGHREGTLVNAILAYLKRQGTRVQGVEGQEINSRESGVGSRESEIQNVLPSAGLKLAKFEIRNSASAAIRPGIVHRLDKDTTGVILIAKDTKTQETLSALFKERSVHKTYRAVVEENIKENEGVIEGNIGRHPTNRKKMAVLKEGGRAALTFFKVLKRLKGFSYVEAYPRTGRTHQIRVHLAHKGYSVAGDVMYGKRAKHIAERPLLHAYRIEFKHPVTCAPVFIEAPVPADIEEFVEKYAI